MDKLTKYTESFCEDCQLWIVVDNCKSCLFNVLNSKKKSEWKDNAYVVD